MKKNFFDFFFEKFLEKNFEGAHTQDFWSIWMTGANVGAHHFLTTSSPPTLFFDCNKVHFLLTTNSPPTHHYDFFHCD